MRERLRSIRRAGSREVSWPCFAVHAASRLKPRLEDAAPDRTIAQNAAARQDARRACMRPAQEGSAAYGVAPRHGSVCASSGSPGFEFRGSGLRGRDSASRAMI